MAIGDAIRRIRKEKGLTQEELAKRIGEKYSYANISQLERGRRKPSPETVIKIANALNVDPKELTDLGELPTDCYPAYNNNGEQDGEIIISGADKEYSAVLEYLEKIGFNIMYHSWDSVPYLHDRRSGKIFKASDKDSFKLEINEIGKSITGFSCYSVERLETRMIEVDKKEVDKKELEEALYKLHLYESFNKNNEEQN